MYDALVIGGGVVGLSAAYHLVQDGAATLLVDRAHPGRATDAGAGIISPQTNTRDPHPWYRLARRAVAAYPQLVRELEAATGLTTGYRVCGKLLLAMDEGQAGPLAAAAAEIEARSGREGVPAPLREVSPAWAVERFPPLARPRKAYFAPEAARVDGRLLAGALLAAARKHGLVVRRELARALLLASGRARGARVGDAEVEARHVIIAGGAWSRRFAEQLGMEVAVEPQRGQIVHLEVEDPETGDWPILMPGNGHYMVTWPGGRVAVGATRETGSGFVPEVTAGGVYEVLDRALRVAPGLAGARYLETRVGLRPISPDGLPLLGPVSGRPGLLLAAGHGPTGLQLGPYSGKLVADLVLGRKPGVELAPFRPDRFA